MKKRDLKVLESDGILNRVAPDLGELVEAKVPHMAVGMCECCGYVEKDKEKTQCIYCDHALFWERLPQSVALSKLYEARCRYKDVAPAGSGTLRSGSFRLLLG